MKQTVVTLLAASALLAAAPVAQAQGYRPINERQAALDNRIDAGVRTGQLTAQEAARLRAEFADIAREEARLRASGRGLTPAERTALDARFDRLSQQIQRNRGDDQRAGGRQGVNARQAEIESRIDAGVRNGSLTRAEAMDLRRESDALARLEADYRDSGRGLTPQERQYLDARLDRLERRLRADRRDDDHRWTNLDRRQASFDQRLNQAVRDRQVSPGEAARLRAEFRSIARLERQYRRSGGGISPSERVELNRRFDGMEARFRTSMTPTDNLFDLLFGLAR